jgi:uncharacterized membrane protein
MNKGKIAMGAILLLAVIAPILAACGSKPGAAVGTATAKNLNATIKQTTIDAQVNGDTVTIPLDAVNKFGNVNFRVDTTNDYFMFMAYEYGDKLFVRADICVPCGSESYTLKNGVLVCNSCGTQFDAQTGIGIAGATSCKSYSKQSVVYQVKDGKIEMKASDLSAAYQKTLKRA